MSNKKFVIEIEISKFCKKITHNGEIDLPLNKSPYSHVGDLWIVKLIKDNIIHYTVEIYKKPIHKTSNVWNAIIKEKQTDKIIALDEASSETINGAIKYFHERIEDGLVERLHINPKFNTDKDFLYDYYLCGFIYPEKTKVHVKIGQIIFKGELVKSAKYDCVTFDVNLFKSDGVTVLRTVTVNKEDVIFKCL